MGEETRRVRGDILDAARLGYDLVEPGTAAFVGRVCEEAPPIRTWHAARREYVAVADHAGVVLVNPCKLRVADEAGGLLEISHDPAAQIPVVPLTSALWEGDYVVCTRHRHGWAASGRLPWCVAHRVRAVNAATGEPVVGACVALDCGPDQVVPAPVYWRDTLDELRVDYGHLQTDADGYVELVAPLCRHADGLTLRAWRFGYQPATLALGRPCPHPKGEESILPMSWVTASTAPALSFRQTNATPRATVAAEFVTLADGRPAWKGCLAIPGEGYASCPDPYVPTAPVAVTTMVSLLAYPDQRLVGGVLSAGWTLVYLAPYSMGDCRQIAYDVCHDLSGAFPGFTGLGGEVSPCLILGASVTFHPSGANCGYGFVMPGVACQQFRIAFGEVA